MVFKTPSSISDLQRNAHQADSMEQGMQIRERFDICEVQWRASQPGYAPIQPISLTLELFE